MNSPDDFLKQLSRRPELLSRIQWLAHLPQAWVHPSRLASSQGLQEEGPTFSLLKETVYENGSPRLQRKVAMQILHDKELGDLDYGIFQNERWRLATLSLDVLTVLTRSVGLFRLAPAFSGMIQSREVNAITKQIGKKSYNLAITQASILLGEKFPEVEISHEELMGNLKSRVLRTGWESLGTALSDAPQSIVKRVALKLPETAEGHFTAAAKENSADAEATGRLLIRVLKNHVNRKVAQCVF